MVEAGVWTVTDAHEHERRVQQRVEQGSDEILKGERWDELRRLTEDELAVRHDACLVWAADVRTREIGEPGPRGTDVETMFLEQALVYRTEHTRREEVRQGKRMEALTRSLNRVTWAIAIATFIGVVIALLTFLAGA